VSDITQILESIGRGKPRATEDLLPVVYQELRSIARYKMSGECAGHTLQATALVHEAWLRLVAAEQQTWKNRAHFFGAAAEAMRRILIDRARSKRALRHGGGQQRVDIEDIEVAAPAQEEVLLAVNDALEKFAVHDREAADLVKLRYFVGMTTEDAAQTLGLSEATAYRYWAYARAWLFKEINSSTT